MSATKTKHEARNSETLASEIKRVQAFVKALSKRLVDPDLPLSATMRLSIRQNELLAYLRGIQYALGEEQSSFELGDVDD
jgi:hypothetical protein